MLKARDGLDPSVANFAGRALKFIGVIVVAILDLFEVETTGVIAVLGAATLAIGLALKDTLANFAAGAMILLFRPFATGDFIEVSGETGTVKNINLFRTEIATVDNVQIIIPNNDTWTTVLKNYSAYDRRRMDLVIGIDYGADMDTAVAAIRGAVTNDPRTLLDPEPFVRVSSLGESSVDITVRDVMGLGAHRRRFGFNHGSEIQVSLPSSARVSVFTGSCRQARPRFIQ